MDTENNTNKNDGDERWAEFNSKGPENFIVIGLLLLFFAAGAALMVFGNSGIKGVLKSPLVLGLSSVGLIFVILSFDSLGDLLLRNPATCFANGLHEVYCTIRGKSTTTLPTSIRVVAVAWTLYGVLHFENWFFQAPWYWTSWHNLLSAPYIVTGLVIAPGLLTISRPRWPIAFICSIAFLCFRVAWFTVPAVRTSIYSIPRFPYSFWEIGTGAFELVLFPVAVVVLWRHKMIFCDSESELTKVARGIHKRIALWVILGVHGAIYIIVTVSLDSVGAPKLDDGLALALYSRFWKSSSSELMEEVSSQWDGGIRSALHVSPRHRKLREEQVLSEDLHMCLMHALERQQTRDLDFIFDHDYDLLSKGGDYGLYYSAMKSKNRVKYFGVLLRRGHPLPTKNKQQCFWLMQAAVECGDLEASEWLIGNGVSLPAQHSRRFELVVAASKSRKLTTMQWLDKNGIPIKIQDEYEQNALNRAIQDKDMAQVKFLVEKCAFDPKRVDAQGSNLLHCHSLSLAKHPDLLDYLLSAGVPINAQNKDGETPLDNLGDGKLSDVFRQRGAKTSEELADEQKGTGQ